MLKNRKIKLFLLLSLILVLIIFGSSHSLHPEDIGGDFLPLIDAGWELHPEGLDQNPNAINYHMGYKDSTYIYDNQVHTWKKKDYAAEDYRTYVDNGIAMWSDAINMVEVEETDDYMGNIRLMVDPNDPATAKCGGHDPELPYYHETSWYIKINIPKFDGKGRKMAHKKRTLAHEIGHVYGLADLGVDYESQIMYGSSSKTKDVTPNDIWGMQICTGDHVLHNIVEYNHEENGYCIEICGTSVEDGCRGYIKSPNSIIYNHDESGYCKELCTHCFQEISSVPNEFTSEWVAIGTVDTCQKLVETCNICSSSYDVEFDYEHSYTSNWIPIGTSDTCQKLVNACSDCNYSYDVEFDYEHTFVQEWVIVGTEEICQKLIDKCSDCNYSYDLQFDYEHSWTDENDLYCNDCGYFRGDVLVTTNLTNDSTGYEFGPIFSPDGSKIAYTTNRDGNSEIYIMNIDGSGQTRLTNNSGLDRYPLFSPDGSKIVFESNRDGNYEIYIMNLDGSGQTNLTNHPALDYSPDFSSDGSKIIFSTLRGNNEIYIMNLDGSGQTNLTNNSASEYYPSFSSDGTKIVFMTRRDGNTEIYIMNIDGSGQTNLTNNPAIDQRPLASSSSSKIAFNSHRDSPGMPNGIYIMNIDGSYPIRVTGVTCLTSDSSTPAFSPDGSKIALKCSCGGVTDIYIADVGGS